MVDTRNAMKKPYPNVFKLGAPRAEEGGKVARPDRRCHCELRASRVSAVL